MAESLMMTLGAMPSGAVVPLTVDQTSRYLRDHVFNDENANRQRLMKRRLDLYHDQPLEQMSKMVSEVFESPELRAKYKKFLPYTQFQNVTRRIINEISMVYASPALRRVSQNDEAYQDLVCEMDLDRRLRIANQYTNLCNEVLLMFRRARSDEAPVMDVITPDRFWVVAHPLDPTHLVAVAFEIKRDGAKPTEPHIVLWSARESMLLDGNKTIISGSINVHAFGQIPGVLVHRRVPTCKLLDSTSGSDLPDGHLSVGLLNLMMLRGAKMGTTIPYATGDIGNTAMGQPMDGETLAVFEEGMSPGTLNLRVVPEDYINAARSVVSQLAANYGIPESVFNLSYSATSGFEIELKRIGLKEKRIEQVIDWRINEKRIVMVMEQVFGGFRADRFLVDFMELELPVDPEARLRVWEQQRRDTLISTVDMVRQSNPEYKTDAEARARIKKNVSDEVWRVGLMRELSQMNANVESIPSDASAEENRQSAREDGNDD